MKIRGKGIPGKGEKGEKTERMGKFSIPAERRADAVCCILLCLAAVWLTLTVRPEAALYGSEKDWLSQHIAFAEYFRDRYLRTGDFFPDFALELGGGQNIYHFSYYGLLSPYVLVSCLFPDIPMERCFFGAALFIIVVSTVLFYLWVRGHLSPFSAFCASVCFLCAAPLLFHTHRQIMFVDYMPFLLLALIAADRRDRLRWRIVLAAAVFLCILTSYFFSAGCFAVLFLAVFAGQKGSASQIQDGQTRKSSLFASVIVPVTAAVALSAFFWLPTGIALLSGSRSGTFSSATASPKNFLFEGILTHCRLTPEPSWLLGGPYTLGLPWIILPAIAVSLFFRRGREKRLPVCLLLLLSIPLFDWLLNGTLYIRPKALIPFLPLYCLLIGEFCQFWIEKTRREKQRFSAFLGAVLLLFVTVAEPLEACVRINQGEHWVSVKRWDSLQIEEKCELAEALQSGTVTRCMDLAAGTAAVNRVYSERLLRTSLYASVFNKDYFRFFSETCGNAMTSRNAMYCSDASNIFFQAFMGVRCLFLPEQAEDVPAGYRKIAQNAVTLYENKRVLPLAWCGLPAMYRDEFEKNPLSARLQALFQTIIIERDPEEGITGGMSAPEDEQAGRQTPAAWFHELTEAEQKTLFSGRMFPLTPSDKEVRLPFSTPQSDAVFLIQFDVISFDRQKDVIITVNGIKNKLSAATAPYPNQNTHFCYVISCENALWEACAAVTPLNFFRGGDPDRLEGTVQLKEDSLVATTIPYDKGFQLTVDGEERDCERVNCAFLGFRLAKGRHKICIVYYAPGKRIGGLLSLFSFAFLVLLFAAKSVKHIIHRIETGRLR